MPNTDEFQTICKWQEKNVSYYNNNSTPLYSIVSNA